MPNSVSVTSHNSYGSRVGNSFKNIFWWIILVIVSIILLVWNENNYLKEKKALEEGAAVVQETTATQIDSSLDQKEVHITWETSSEADALTDNDFWVTTNDLKLKRTVEMYQWYEESSESCTDNLWWSQDCTTTYDYSKKWSDAHINSNNFYQSNWYENPSVWEYDSNEQEKSPINLWVYTLTDTFVSALTNYTPINLGEQNIIVPDKYKVTENNNSNDSVEENNDNYLYGDNNTATSSKFHVNSNYIYIWTDPNSPTIWDLRITFSSVKPWTISIVWKQSWNELRAYTTKNWRSIALLQQWTVSAEEMFIAAQKSNKIMTWILRFVWLLLMFAWFSMMLEFIEILAKVVPFIAKIIWVGTKLIALCLTLVVWFVTIGIAWLAVRPIIWICCLVVAAGWIFLLAKSKKNKGSEGIEAWEKDVKVEEPKEVIE